MNRIEEQARYYRNIPLRNRSIKAVVHLEDAEDMLFWNPQLQNAFPATYHFITFSKNEKDNDVPQTITVYNHTKTTENN